MKVFAFYLPQFHRVPTNDEWWGEGFTEWTAAKNAKPLYGGHYQPHEPLNDKYYNLLDKETMIWQAKLMHEYAIDGFCMYHYWFSSKEKVLEKPVENLLSWKDIDMPFCLTWANESWLNKWSNREGLHWNNVNLSKKVKREVIFQQTYGREDDWKVHFEYLLPFFMDDRYIRIEGKPLFIIYLLDNIPCINQMIEYWNELAKNEGLPGLYVMGVGSLFREYGVDSVITHEPGSVGHSINVLNKNEFPKRFSYDDAYKKILSGKYASEKHIVYTALSSYDTTPRYGKYGEVFEGATPEKFCKYLAELMAKNEAAGENITIINAWNEWGEGMHLEPDKKDGVKWLEAVKKAKEEYGQYVERYKNENEQISESEYDIYCEKEKISIYYSVINKWMTIKEKGRLAIDSIKERLDNGIIIYGSGVLTDHLIWECKEVGISVKGIIDRASVVNLEGISVFKVEDEWPEADAIIVTAFYHMRDICNSVRKVNKDILIYSLDEIIAMSE